MRNRTTCAEAMLAVFLALTASIMPAGAQPKAQPAHSEAVGLLPGAQRPIDIAIDLNSRRSGLYKQEDLAGIAALYTADAMYIELLPVLQVLKGRDQIRGHFEELINASAVNIVPTVLSAEKKPDGTIRVSGDYVVLSSEGAQTEGHFVQTLRFEDGTWRIAEHVFARPDPITAAEMSRAPRD